LGPSLTKKAHLDRFWQKPVFWQKFIRLWPRAILALFAKMRFSSKKASFGGFCPFFGPISIEKARGFWVPKKGPKKAQNGHFGQKGGKMAKKGHF